MARQVVTEYPQIRHYCIEISIMSLKRQWSVVSGQWSVVSGQWSVGQGGDDNDGSISAKRIRKDV
ncbi:hypothetical protein [Shewanella sp. NIFS-20-20]|uniref:hypothetical protein n=1 Tax=Shewanella sp. NIFS-20-20 TaxID=2853806 RepID=UPI001C458C5E|nr:hypothetical protein [Shewanella sp. NIFS-20-20]MBV7316016.1 hypothetical protein [Shewanella sp. NIFS-20-20]